MNRLDIAIASMPDDLIHGKLCDGEGHYCGVGFLAHLIGISDEDMTMGDSNKVYQAVDAAYMLPRGTGRGVHHVGTNAVVSANDRATTAADRKEFVNDVLITIRNKLASLRAEELAQPTT